MLDQKPRLLIIDDDDQIRRVYARLLGTSFCISTEPDALGGLRRIADGEIFDVILCDLVLGNTMSGKGFYEQLERRWPALASRTMICSGLARAEDDPFVMALGDRYFMKLDAIPTLMARLLRMASPRVVSVAA